jgi:predicted PurR-regulated permease PerM
VVVPRWIQLVALPLTALAAWALAKAAGKVLLLFIIAALIALILNPAVALVQRGRMPRGIAVLAVYVAFFVGLAGIGVLLANPISNQVRTFTNNLPTITNEANKKLAELETTLNQNGFHVHIVKPGKTALQSIQAKVTKSASKFLSFGGALLTEVANAIFNLVLIFVLSVYMLLYGRQIGALIRRVMPPGDGSRADDYPRRGSAPDLVTSGGSSCSARSWAPRRASRCTSSACSGSSPTAASTRSRSGCSTPLWSSCRT